MAEIVSNCPRCSASNTTFDITHSHVVGERYGWQKQAEIQCVCRRCKRGVIFLAEQKQSERPVREAIESGLHRLQNANVNSFVEIVRHISVRDGTPAAPPEYLPAEIDAAFREGAACAAIDCYNAAAAMFRLCIDQATRSLLPKEDVNGLNGKIRRSLGLRLTWLFDTQRLPSALRELSEALKEDGNDGAHEGTLTKTDSEDLHDFAIALLERLYTEPKRIELAEERRKARRAAARKAERERD